MASNDETLLAVPNIQCPSCNQQLDISKARQFNKLSKAQRKELLKGDTYSTVAGGGRHPQVDQDMEPDDSPEHIFVVVSCENYYCKQYNRFKVFKLPKISAPSVTLSLE